MAAKVIRPKPGVYRGIKMRSQLEIAWAKYWDSVGATWEYVDGRHFDFEVNGFTFEVKPPVITLIWQAVKKWWLCDSSLDRDAEVTEHLDSIYGSTAKILCGNPPSAYGSPVLLFATLNKRGTVFLCASRFLAALSDGQTCKVQPGPWEAVNVHPEDRVLLRLSELVGEEV